MITDKNKVWADKACNNLISFGNYSVVLSGNGWNDLGADGFHSYCEHGDKIIIYDNDAKDIIFTLITHLTHEYEI